MSPSDESPAVRKKSSEKIVVGQLGAPYGVRGWLHVRSFTEPAENLFQYQPLYLNQAGAWQTVELLNRRVHRGGYVVQLAGVDDRDVAARYAKQNLAIDAATLPGLDANEVYWRDLIGMRVVNVDGEPLGEVSDLLETGAHDVLVVQTPGLKGERLIPFTDPYLEEIDKDAGCVRVNWQADW